MRSMHEVQRRSPERNGRSGPSGHDVNSFSPERRGGNAAMTTPYRTQQYY